MVRTAVFIAQLLVDRFTRNVREVGENADAQDDADDGGDRPDGALLLWLWVGGSWVRGICGIAWWLIEIMP
jgi:hypothetical protein